VSCVVAEYSSLLTLDEIKSMMAADRGQKQTRNDIYALSL
jgi:hypothetical protein